MGSRVAVITFRDQMLRVWRFSCGFFTAMAGNKAGNKAENEAGNKAGNEAGKKNQGSIMYFDALS